MRFYTAIVIASEAPSGRAFFSLLLILWVLALAPTEASAEADTPLPYGFLLLPAEMAEPSIRPTRSTNAPSPINSEAVERLSRSIEAIAALEAAQGPYHAGLAEPLLEAAATAREMNRDDTAIELYSWALQNLRINQGLATDNQLPVVEALLELHREAGDLEAVNDREAYVFRLAGNGQQPLSDESLRAAERYLAWWQEWLVLQEGEYRGRELWDLHQTGSDLAESVCESTAFAARWCAPLTLRALGSLYLIDYQVEPISEFVDPRRRAVRPDWDQNPFDDRLYALEDAAYATGARMLQTAMERVPDDPDLRLALADWRWFQGRRGAAREDYRGLYADLRGRFERPEPLPVLPGFRRDTRLARDSDPVMIRAEITSSGRARQVEIIGPGQVEEGVRVRARRALRETRFRPRLDANGEPENAVIELDLLALR
jgi:hypothetical protein